MGAVSTPKSLLMRAKFFHFRLVGMFSGPGRREHLFSIG